MGTLRNSNAYIIGLDGKNWLKGMFIHRDLDNLISQQTDRQADGQFITTDPTWP